MLVIACQGFLQISDTLDMYQNRIIKVRNLICYSHFLFSEIEHDKLKKNNQF
jgi:hypothetical protein